jgi:hypothetical protein
VSMDLFIDLCGLFSLFLFIWCNGFGSSFTAFYKILLGAGGHHGVQNIFGHASERRAC